MQTKYAALHLSQSLLTLTLYQFLVIKTRLAEQKGRKVKVAGTIEDLDGNVLVEAEYVSTPPFLLRLGFTLFMQCAVHPAQVREALEHSADARIHW